MNNKMAAKERRHVGWTKEQDCVVCGASGPSDAHHIVQHLQYLVIPLCKDCHQGSHNGIHGRRAMWNVMGMDEMKALDKHLANALGGGR